jgi:hypothetical protein
LSDTLIRLSPGVEHPEDLVADLLAGLEHLQSDAVEGATSPARSSFSPSTVHTAGRG